MNSLMLSGDLRKKLAKCKVGKPETIEITINPTKVGDGEIEATVTGIEYEAEAKSDKAMPMMKKSRRPKALESAIAADY